MREATEVATAPKISGDVGTSRWFIARTIRVASTVAAIED